MSLTNKFRQQIDNCSSYSELIPEIQIMVEKPLNKESGNSCLHALSLLNESHLDYQEWVSLLNPLLESFTQDKFDKSTYPSLMSVYCTSFGYRLLEEQKGFQNMIESLLDLMEQKEIVLRKRTLSPLLELCYREHMPSLAMSVFGLAKVSNIILDSMDLSYLITTVTGMDKKTILKEILNTQNLFQETDIIQLQKYYSIKKYMVEEKEKLGNFSLPCFKLSIVEQKRVIKNINDRITEKTSHRRVARDSFIKFSKNFNKKTTVFVDGANLGRYQQGTRSQGSLNYKQIKNVVKALKEQNHKVVVCLNENHLKKMDETAKKEMTEIKKISQVCSTPSGLDDDLCWLYACFTLPNTYLVTNDELRNHIYQIDSKIETWKEYKRITYDICRESGDISFNYPLPYEVKPTIESSDNGRYLWLPLTNKEWYKVEL